jgi:prophage regulatory protein
MEAKMTGEAATGGSDMRILKLGEVEAKTGLTRSSLYAETKAGRFPCPLKLTARSLGWLSIEVDDWIRSRPRAGLLISGS